MSRLGSKSLMQDLLVEYGSLLPKDFEAKAELSYNYAWVTVMGNSSYNYTSSFKSDSMECCRGIRYQLKVEQENAPNESKEIMSASVEAGYKGIVSVQDSVTSTTEISIYLRPCRPTCLVRGGDPSAAEKLMKDPENLEKFEAWVNSRTEGATDALINIRVEHYRTLLQRCPDQSRPHGQQLSAA
ncbi:hypothetical protein ETB97_003838 [Aspergillus alliaceus]|uniref:Uncharacterized protein n=1 Tax=Petromyces alliaceus TaxID=209559 RepID=A0A8H6A0J5_PETAA|nr:hypothetical protein ETB97_003838 [Aspergillus burnettii]